MEARSGSSNPFMTKRALALGSVEPGRSFPCENPATPHHLVITKGTPSQPTYCLVTHPCFDLLLLGTLKLFFVGRAQCVPLNFHLLFPRLRCQKQPFSYFGTSQNTVSTPLLTFISGPSHKPISQKPDSSGGNSTSSPNRRSWSSSGTGIS